MEMKWDEMRCFGLCSCGTNIDCGVIAFEGYPKVSKVCFGSVG